jgi:hypothetical protein
MKNRSFTVFQYQYRAIPKYLPAKSDYVENLAGRFILWDLKI